MKRYKIRVFLWMMLLSSTWVSAAADSVFYTCFVVGDMERWAMEMKKLAAKDGIDQNFSALKQLAFARYGYVGYLFEEDRSNEAGELLEALEKNLEKLEEMQAENPEILALHGAYFGMKIELQKWKAPSYGMKSMSYINEAFEIDSLNGYVLSEKANMTYHMPSVFGGGIKNAIPILENAVAKMEAEPEQYKQNWLYLLSKSTLGSWYVEVENYDKAINLFQQLLSIEPGFTWVRDELLPEAKRKAAGK